MRFENRTGNHNKFYEIEVQPGPNDTFRVFTSWGPITWSGEARVKHKVIFEGDVEGAIKAFEKKRNDRIRHGYTQVD